MASPPEPRRTRRTSLLVFVGLVVVYSVNGREIGAVDTTANMLLPVALLRGDGLVLNRYAGWVSDHHYVRLHGDDLVSRYPPLPALVALPATWLQVALLDRTFANWESDPLVHYWWIRTMAKNAAVLVAALTAVLLHRLLLQLGLAEVALTSTLAVALGSNLWMVGSQSPWLHGTVALFLTLALWLLAPPRLSRARLAAGGLALALAVCGRPTSLVFAVPLGLWALLSQGRRVLWLLVPAGAVGALLLAYNWIVFEDVLGGMGEIEAMGHAQHGVPGALTRQPLTSLLGTLVSPARGLFVYSPWALLALAVLPATRARIAAFPLLRAAGVGLLLFTAVNASYAVWWGGWSFGPRYWTEAMPLLGVLLGFALAWARERSRLALSAFGAAIGVAIALQAIGAFTYPSSWNREPVTVDLAHERLWDWRDTEIRRGLAEGPHWPASWSLIAQAFASD